SRELGDRIAKAADLLAERHGVAVAELLESRASPRVMIEIRERAAHGRTSARERFETFERRLEPFPREARWVGDRDRDLGPILEGRRTADRLPRGDAERRDRLG